MILPSPELVERYRTRAPRYTSYPTAPQFKALPENSLETALSTVNGPLSLYLHIPFCTHLCLYCGCHVEIKESRSIADPYIEFLHKEIELWRDRLPTQAHQTAQICLGGGTPTFLRQDQMQTLIQGMQTRLPWTPAIDASIEIDPRSVDDDYLKALVQMGFNRFSFGVQDFDEDVLKAVARPQSEAKVRQCTQTLREAAPEANLNFDLMYGLPHQNLQSFERTLQSITEIRPTRIALFHYAHVPWMKPAQKVLEKRGLPETDLKTQLYALATERLTDAGYSIIGMDHFALPGDELLAAQQRGDLQRNFMGYTTHASLDQLGLGVSAIGAFAGVYAQNYKDRATWSERISAGQLPVERGYLLSPEDRCRRDLIMQLFCNFNVKLSKEESVRYQAELQRLMPMQDDGILSIQSDARHTTLQVSDLGRHFIRNVCAVFDQYIEGEQSARRYSMTA